MTSFIIQWRNRNKVSRWTRLLTALVVAIAGLLPMAIAQPALADTGGYPWSSAPCADSGSSLGHTTGTGYWCSDYNWGESTCPSGDGYCTSGWELNGYYLLDKWGEGFRNCTSYAAWKLNSVFSIDPNDWGNGADWNTSAIGAGYSDDSSPQAGDIAQWNATTGNPWGHVAYVDHVTSGVAYYDEYNYGEDGNYTSNYTSSTQGAPDNWIHIGSITGGGGGGSTYSTSGENLGPSAFVNTSSKELYVFGVGADGNVYVRADLNGWASWQNVGNGGVSIVGHPSAFMDQATGEFYVLANGTDGNVYAISHSPTSGWASWQNVGNGGSNFTGSPSAFVDQSNGELYVFDTGTNGHMYVRADNSGWGSWSDLGNDGSNFTGSPSAFIDPSNGELYVFANGSDGNVYVRAHGSGGWASWVNAGKDGSVSLTGSPSAFVDPTNSEFYVFANGSDGNVYARSHSVSGGWASWTDVGNDGSNFTGSPSAFIDPSNGELYVFANGSDGNVYARSDLSGWASWTDVGNDGSNFTGSPSAFVNPNNHELYVFVVGTDGNVYARSDLSGWASWTEVDNDGSAINS